MTASLPKHLVLIPAYNPGARLELTVRAVLAHWSTVWVVVDGSTDGSHDFLSALSASNSGVRMLDRATNGGKGAAVLTGARAALEAGFTHALVMDADGQHPAEQIAEFMEKSGDEPKAMILGQPLFGPEAPKVRLYGRKLSVGIVHLETGGRVIADPLFGFRVYPLAPLVQVLESTGGARHYDFDPEVAVRLVWAGVPVENVKATCRYLSADEGGVSHFHYFRDNLRMIWLHTRLLFARVFYYGPAMIMRRFSSNQ